MAKGYRVLGKNEERKQCSFVLINRMQCWQLGTEEVTAVTPSGGKSIYQLCERHVKIQQAIDIGQLPTTESGVAPDIKEEQKKEAQKNLAEQILNR